MIDRQGLADCLGYKTVKEMYQEMYVQNGWSSLKIGKRLGISDQTVRNDLRNLQILLENRGGFYSANCCCSILDKLCCLPLQELERDTCSQIVRRLRMPFGNHTVIKKYLLMHFGINKTR